MPALVPTGKNASELLKSYYVIAKRNSRKVLEGRHGVLQATVGRPTGQLQSREGFCCEEVKDLHEKRLRGLHELIE